MPENVNTAPVTATGEQVEQFVRGYVTALFWSSSEVSPDGAYPGKTWDDLNHWGWLTAIRDCTRFIGENFADLLEYAERREYDPSEGTAWDYAGHDFALTRNGAGVGFWDQGLGALGDRLSDAARAFGESDLEVGDDGTVGIFPA